jgi:F-type H+-transporting ATPase subunit b
MFLSLDGTFWFQLINFAVFFAILNVVFLRPVGAAIKKRREHIDSVQSDYERYAHQVSTLRGDADARRGAARRAAEETIAKARAAAETEAQAIIEAQTAQAHAIVEQARATVALEVEGARAREAELSQTLANVLLERALGGKP